MRITTIFLLVILLGSLASCKKNAITEKDVITQGKDVSTQTEQNVLDANQKIHPIQCKVGEDFTISLEGNPSTGYNWDFQAGFDTTMVKFIKSETKSTSQDENIVGDPSVFSWTFTALKEGSTEATLFYKRQWESDPVNDKTVIIQVTITK